MWQALQEIKAQQQQQHQHTSNVSSTTAYTPHISAQRNQAWTPTHVDIRGFVTDSDQREHQGLVKSQVEAYLVLFSSNTPSLHAQVDQAEQETANRYLVRAKIIITLQSNVDCWLVKGQLVKVLQGDPNMKINERVPICGVQYPHGNFHTPKPR